MTVNIYSINTLPSPPPPRHNLALATEARGKKATRGLCATPYAVEHPRCNLGGQPLSARHIDRTSALPLRQFPVPQKTERLVIRRFNLEDAAAIYSIHGDPLASRYMGGTLTRDQSFKNLCALIRRVEESGYGPFAVTLPGGGEPIGWAGIQQLPGEACLEILFALVPTHWGRGYATEAARHLLSFAFDDCSREEIFATVHPDNQASIRVLSRLGFRSVGPYVHKLGGAKGVLYRVDGAGFSNADLPEAGL